MHASKRSIDGAKEHHACFKTQHRWCERAPCMLQNAASMVRKSTIVEMFGADSDGVFAFGDSG
jgi:hypothetical protein